MSTCEGAGGQQEGRISISFLLYSCHERPGNVAVQSLSQASRGSFVSIVPLMLAG